VVSVGSLAKTIAMGKEVFTCTDAQSRLAQIKDVETFIEVAERGRSGHKPSITTTSKFIDVTTCTKDLSTGRVSCTTAAMPLGTTKTPLAGCSLTRGTYPFSPLEQPTHPVAMSSTVVARQLVKTVKVELEVFSCGGRIADLYIFSDRVEAPARFTFRRVATEYAGVVCFKTEATAKVAECRLFEP
jgi:hypothetical protein